MQIYQQYLPPVDENTDESNQAEDGEGGDDSQRNHSLPLLFPDWTNSRLVAAVTSICREITPKELAAKKTLLESRNKSQNPPTF